MNLVLALDHTNFCFHVMPQKHQKSPSNQVGITNYMWVWQCVWFLLATLTGSCFGCQKLIKKLTRLIKKLTRPKFGRLL